MLKDFESYTFWVSVLHHNW